MISPETTASSSSLLIGRSSNSDAITININTATVAPSVEQTFQTLFPSYSHSSFSRLLEEEEDGTASSSMDDALDALCDETSWMTNDSIIKNEDNILTSHGQHVQHPGYLGACNANAMDGNLTTSFEEPLYFLNPSAGGTTSTSTMPMTIKEEDSIADVPALATVIPIASSSPASSRKRVWNSDAVQATATNMLQKARRISIASSCGVIAEQAVEQQPLNTDPTTFMSEELIDEVLKEAATVQEELPTIVPEVACTTASAPVVDDVSSVAVVQVKEESKKAKATHCVPSVQEDPDLQTVVSNPLHHQNLAKALSDAAAKDGLPALPTEPELVTIPKISRIEMKHLSKPEKEQLSRERNRVHAKNTRLRKKAHVEDLKQHLMDLVQERDAAVASRERTALICKQNKDVRYLVMNNFMTQLQEPNYPRWKTLLKEDVSFTFPSCHHDGEASTRNINACCERTASSVSQVMASSSELAKSLQTISRDPSLQLSYTCDRKSLLMDGATVVVEVTANRTAATNNPLLMAPATRMMGSFKATFCVQTNKIQSACLVLDTGCLVPQQA